MVRSLWSAATGMNAQQTNVDTIANNLANVNSAGYKAQVAQFKSLLYQTLQTATTTANGDPKPVTSQVGLGVRTAAINQLLAREAFCHRRAIPLLPFRVMDSLQSVMPMGKQIIRETAISHGPREGRTVLCSPPRMGFRCWIQMGGILPWQEMLSQIKLQSAAMVL